MGTRESGDSEPKRLPLKPAQVWAYDSEEGYRNSIETAGAVAAPLLAGFSLTLLGLVVPSLTEERTVVSGANGVRAVTEKSGVSAAPELAAGLLLVAGILLIFSVQVAVALRRHNHAPSQLQELWPQHFPQSRDGTDEADVPADLVGWEYTEAYANAVPIRVGRQWYSGFVRSFLYSEWAKADTYADRMRALYHGGILALLAGLTALVVPPADNSTPERWALVAVAAAGVVIELVWIWRVSDLYKRLTRMTPAGSGGRDGSRARTGVGGKSAETNPAAD